jgi:hypothetical protein
MPANITYDAPPTVARFMKSNAFFRIIAGPVGSGKTTGCIFEFLRRAIEQSPAPDGFRYTRFAIVRQTLEQLRMTVLKDIEAWLAGVARYKVSEKTVYVEFGDVRSEWLLVPLEDPEDQRRLLSSQLTGIWMSEAIEIDVNLVPPILGRLWRYPSGVRGVPNWSGAIADTNMPTEGSPWHRFMALDRPPEWDCYIQPGGLEPDAENLNWLAQTKDTLALPIDNPDRLAAGRLYYERLSRNPSPDWVKRYVHAQYGNDPSGSAVFRETFKGSFHTADEVLPVMGHPIVVSQDFGRNPCGIIGQLDHKGRLLILQELISEDIGLELHINRILRPALMDQRFLGKSVYIIGDPAGRQRSTSYEETSFDLLTRAGLTAYPAPTNDIDKRLRAVEAYLLGQRDGGPALLIDKQRCPTLVLALQGRYRYAKRKSGQLAPLPEKLHPWSDVADALQYLCLVAHGGVTNYVANRMARAAQYSSSQRGPKFTSAAWT